MSLRIAMTYGRIRPEEKLLLEAFDRHGLACEPVDDRRMVLDLASREPEFDVVLDRSLSFGRARTIASIHERAGTTCLNSAAAIALCGDKIETQLACEIAGLPTPQTRVAFSREAALEAIEELGYPAVLKPTIGSWGRLVARLNDRHAAEAVLEDRDVLGNWTHHVYYVQELVKKPGRDIRLFVIGGEAVAAIYRYSDHWITNTARGGRAENCPVDDELQTIGREAARASGADLLAVDVIEDEDGRRLVLELNHSMEFRNSIETTGVDIPARIVEHVAARAERSIAC